MISRLTGKIIHADLRSIVVDVHGVGYKIYTTAGILERQIGTEATFWTYLAVREDALDLYGFSNPEELEFFQLLITVSSIGPKTALGILNVTNPATIKKAIVTEDPSYLTKVSGIGRKTAEKIVLELKDKLIVSAEDTESATMIGESDALDALKALGYTEKESRDALKKVPADIEDTGERVKRALKVLNIK
jgi:Holliday junction DNA helicase RuvA